VVALVAGDEAEPNAGDGDELRAELVPVSGAAGSERAAGPAGSEWPLPSRLQATAVSDGATLCCRSVGSRF
jgi:hypothetical protein